MKKLIAMLLAVTMVLALAACAKTEAPVTTAAPETTEAATEATTEAPTEAETTAPAEENTVMTYEEYMAAEVDSKVTVETYVQAHQSWWEDKITVYAQSPEGAMFLYELACSEEDAAKMVPGTKIRVTGDKAEWNGEVEIMNGTFEFVEGDSFVAEAADLTALLGTDDLAAHQNEFVTLKGLTVEAANDEGAAYLYKWDGSGEEGDDLYFNVSLDGKTYSFTVESYLRDKDSDVYKAVKELKVGDVVDLEGYLYWYNDAQLHTTSVAAAQ